MDVGISFGYLTSVWYYSTLVIKDTGIDGHIFLVIWSDNNFIVVIVAHNLFLLTQFIYKIIFVYSFNVLNNPFLILPGINKKSYLVIKDYFPM